MKKVFTYLLATLLFAGHGWATDVIGSISGNLAVSESGAATYTIPLDYLQGDNDFSPSLSLVYNSQAGNGLVGYGWGLSGLSAITIGPRNVYFDGTAEGVYRGKDNAYYLDGMRLLLVSGTNGQVGATYRTEAEQYSEISITSTLGNTPASFTVKNKDGSIYRYGSLTGRMMYSDNECYEWALDYAEDRLGNYITYTYAQDGLTLYPTSITYGKNTHNSAALTYTVTFNYESRADSIQVHRFGETRPFTKRLSQISCTAGTTTYRRYDLTYATNVYSHLTSIKEVGLNSTSYPETVFTWENLPTLNFEDATPSLPATGDVTFPEIKYIAGDIDNDGYTELVGLYGTTSGNNSLWKARIWKKNDTNGNFSHVNGYYALGNMTDLDMQVYTRFAEGGALGHINNAHGNSLVIPSFEYTAGSREIVFHFFTGGINDYVYALQSNGNQFSYTHADINNDGQDEIILIERDNAYGRYPASFIHYNYATAHFDSCKVNMNLADHPTRLIASDFNADGMADLLVCTTAGFYIYWNNAGTFSDDRRYFNTTFNECDVLEVCDVNGDGLPDLVANKHNTGVWLSCVNQGDTTNVFQFHQITALQASSSNKYRAYCIVNDLNGDGKTDIVVGIPYFEGNTSYGGQLAVLLSDGTNYSNTATYAFPSESTFPAFGRVVQGDFDGDGTIEIMYYGGTGNSTDTNVAWHILKPGGYTSATNRITKITDGLGVEQNITYSRLTDTSVYPSGTNMGTETFPLFRLRAALPVAKRIETIAGQDSLWTDYTYGKAVFHWQGKRFLGFRERSVTDHVGNRTEVHSDVNTDYYVLYKTSENTYACDNSLWKTDSIKTTFKPVESKSYFAYSEYSCSNDIANEWEDKVTADYNAQGNLSGKKTFTDGMFIRDTEYAYGDSAFANVYITHLPLLIKTTQWGGNLDMQETERIEFTRDSLTGQPLICRKYQNDTLTETELFTYNAYGKVLTHTVIKGSSTDSLTTTYQYMAKGLLYKETDPMGQQTTYYYNEYGLPTREVNHLGMQTNYTYDNMLRSKGYTSPLASNVKAIASTTYGNAAYQITETRKGQPTLITYYDRLGRKVADAERRFDGRYLYTDYRYLKNGKTGFVSFPHTSSSPSATGTTSTYDQFDRLISQTDTQGKTSTWNYQPSCVTSTIDGVTRTTHYGSRDIVVGVEDDSGDVDFDVDAYGRVVTALHYPYGNTVSYDDFGRITQTNDMLGTARSYTYDANGYPLSVIQGTSTRQSQYDKYGRMLSQTFHDSGLTDTQTFYTYNALNQLVCDSSSNHVYRYEYDNYGRVTKETRSVKADSTETVTYTYAYNINNQLSQKTILLGSAGTTLTESYTYAYGWRKSISVNGTQVWKLNGEDNTGHTQMTSNAMDTIQWSHDVYGHLLSQNVHGLHSLSQSYTYNTATGNLTQKNSHTYTYDSLNQLTGWNGMTYAYDSRGNLTQMDPLGTMQYSGFKLNSVNIVLPADTFQYDFSYYKSIERPHGISDGNKGVQFAYDGSRQRVWMKSFYRPYLQPIVNTGIRYYLSDDCEIDQKFSSHKRYYYYVGGTPYDAPAVVLVENSVPTVYQIYRDNIGSMVMYASSASTKSLYYSPWGQRLQNATGVTPYTYPADELFIRSYTGHEELPYFHLLNANARIYNPVLGRFLSPDPLLALNGNPLDFNPYIYAHNNPFSYVDQDGENPFAILIAALIGGAFNVASNWNNIGSFGEGFLYFGVGAASSVIGSIISPFAIGGFAGGALNTALSNAVSSFILASGNAAISGGNILQAGWNAAWQSAISGFVIGGLSGGFEALSNGNNFWTGKSYTSNLDIPRYSEEFIPEIDYTTKFIDSPISQNTSKIKPYQNHHLAPYNNKSHSNQYREIANIYGLDLKDKEQMWNVVNVPHLGSHPTDYKDWVLKQMQDAHSIANGNKSIFLYEFKRRVEIPVKNNVDMLDKWWWKEPENIIKLDKYRY